MMMKRILTVLLMFVVVTEANAQYLQQEQDTLRITMKNNKVHDFIWGDFKRVDFSMDYTKVIVKEEDKDISFDLDNVKSIRFYNHFSNPEVVLKAQGSGAYDGLFQLSAYPKQMFFFISCLASDEMFGGGLSQSHEIHEYDLLMNGFNGSNLRGSWDNYYKSIFNVNTSILQLQNLPPEVSIAEQRHALGEAHFMRAYFYYELASLFGAVPIITDNKSWAQKMTRTTPAQVWGQILYDLKTAITEMNEKTSSDMDDSRVGKYAAEAMLARAYLFYTGFYLGAHDIATTSEANIYLPDGTKLTKKDVIAYIEDCVNNSGFTLVADFRNLWPYTNRLTREYYTYTVGKNLAWVEDDGGVNPEILFKIKYNKYADWETPGYANWIAYYFGIPRENNPSTIPGTFPFGDGLGYGTVSPAFYYDWSMAEPQDMRRDASIQDVEQLPAYRYGGDPEKPDHVQETKYHEKKLSPIYCYDSYGSFYPYYPFEQVMYGLNNSNNSIFSNIHPLNLIRFADVLLMHSELTGTVNGINRVRTRAGLSPLTGYTLEALQQERRWELAFEGVRWNDMRRFGEDYCKAALDAQMDQPIYNKGESATNPNGIQVYDADSRPYSAHYAENKGFFEKPEGYGQEGGMLVPLIRGEWTYDEGENTLYLDKVNIDNTSATRYDPACKEVATGLFVITPTDNYDQRICQITFLNGSMLPLSKNYSDKEGTMTYDLISLNSNNMVLKSNGKELKLRRTDGLASKAGKIHGVKWSYGTCTYFNSIIGTYGLISREVVDIWGIYHSYIQGTAATDLTAFVKANNMTVAEGEADPFAYMVFDLYENSIKKFTADGNLINTGTFTLERGKGDVIIHTSDNATLVPYMCNGQSETTKDFSLCYDPLETYYYGSPFLVLTSRSMIDNMKTYWLFGQRGLTTEEFDKTLIIQQRESDGTLSATGRFLSVSIDRARFCIYVEDAETGEQVTVLEENTPFKIKVKSGQSVTKKLRFRMKNSNDTEAVVERTLTFANPDPVQRFYIYPRPGREDVDLPFQAVAWDAAAMRFSSTYGAHLPTISDDIYYDLKTLIFDVSDVSADFDLKVMNAWWSNTYYDHVKWDSGLNELQITETMAKECAKGGEGRDLDLMLYSGSMTLNSVYYEE